MRIASSSFSPCGRRWPRQARSDEGAPAWRRRHSVTHPSTVSALRADPPSPAGERWIGPHKTIVQRKLNFHLRSPSYRCVRSIPSFPSP
ncbi:hypothetical protein GNX14_18685 [Mesorhizobium japonicum]|nr:hypothetical protein [Mesorhizobium japonicum]MUT30025.1 hypothetical protein [Mesorhizobium japonicum]